VVIRFAQIGLLCAGLSIALGVPPAAAGWFDSTPAAPAQAKSDDAAAEIQRDLDDEQYLDAGKVLDGALLADPENPKLVLLAGELSLANSHYAIALADFKSVDTIPEEKARALEGEGIALSLLGKSDAAFAVLKSSVAQPSPSWRAWNALGTEYDKRHDWADAEDAYNHAAADPASTAIVLNNRGFSRLCQNHLDEAVADFVSALAKKPDFAAARNNLRLAIGMKGEYDRAIEGTNGPDRAAVLNNVGFAALMRGDYVAAKDFFDQAIKAKGTYYSLAASNLETTQTLASSHHDKPDDAHAGTH
jgi:Flp pilus assembly protein TadD